jgi:hypothetical protein
MEYRYYIKLRPYSPGAAPGDGLISFLNYDRRTFVEDAGCEVWGELIYDRQLPLEDELLYDLVQGGNKPYHKVRSRRDENGNMKRVYHGVQYLPGKPAGLATQLNRYTLFTDWFDTEAEALAFVKGGN